MATLYDSTSANDIPSDAPLVGGYVDGLYRWTSADWARFPNSTQVRIAVSPATNDGFVLDVEQGDATPAQAPVWVQMRRNAKIGNATIYCSRSVLPEIQAAFTAAGVAQPFYWVADWTGTVHMVPGAVATQYADPPASGGHFDLSVTNDVWPHIAPAPVLPSTPNHLAAGQILHEGEALYDVTYFCTLQTDGNLVVYTSDNKVVWSSNTKHSSTNPGPFFLEMQNDGNAVIYDANTQPVWSTAPKGSNSYLVMQTDGNLVVYVSKPAWASKG